MTYIGGQVCNLCAPLVCIHHMYTGRGESAQVGDVMVASPVGGALTSPGSDESAVHTLTSIRPTASTPRSRDPHRAPASSRDSVADLSRDCFGIQLAATSLRSPGKPSDVCGGEGYVMCCDTFRGGLVCSEDVACHVSPSWKKWYIPSMCDVSPCKGDWYIPRMCVVVTRPL